MKYIKYLVFAVLIAFILGLLNANAAIADLVNSGDSLKGRVSIGSQKVGANYYYSFNDNAYDQSILNLNIPIKYMYGLSSNASGSGSGTIDVGFQVDYCVNNPNAGIESIYSYYENSVDFTYNNGTKMYLSDADWTQSSCFTSFVKLKLNYSLNYGVSDPSTSFTSLTDRDNTFAVHNTYGYVGIIRYTDMIYLDEDDYNQRLEEAKSIYTQQNQNQEIIDKQDETNDKLDELNDSINSDSEDTASKSCGIICKLKGIFTGIIELPSKLVNLLIDGLKSLFVPTDEQLLEIVEDSSELAENFGFVGESMNFFIDIFTSFLGLVNANGCAVLPEFTIGETSLFDEHTFWEEQQVCLNDNKILSDNIDTIRTITSIVLVCMFINFAASKFFGILSKNDSGTSYSYNPDGSGTYTEWSVVNGTRVSQRRNLP